MSSNSVINIGILSLSLFFSSVFNLLAWESVLTAIEKHSVEHNVDVLEMYPQCQIEQVNHGSF